MKKKKKKKNNWTKQLDDNSKNYVLLFERSFSTIQLPNFAN